MSEFDGYDALGLAELVRKGEATPAELLDDARTRIQERNPGVEAVWETLFEQAESEVNAGVPAGPFSGVPFLIKDLGVDYRGVPTTRGSRFFADAVASADSQLVGRYRAAGLVIVGKSATSEHGMGANPDTDLYPVTRNPWNPERIAGGSSGGAAAAVAARMVPMAHASDGGGSIRCPASCCGVFGLKPTRERISNAPRGEAWGGFSAHHAITVSVRDSAALLDATAGRTDGDAHSAPPSAGSFLDATRRAPGRLRIGFYLEEAGGNPVDPEVAEAVLSTAHLLEEMGHDVTQGRPEWDRGGVAPMYALITGTELLRDVTDREQALGREVGDGDLLPVTRYLAERARGISAIDYVQARRAIVTAGRQIAASFEHFDLFLSPTMTNVPGPLREFDLRTDDVSSWLDRIVNFAPYLHAANISGNPAMSVPMRWTADGLPVGVQVLGRYGDESTLFSVASALEQARPWASRVPSLSTP